jgi:hypothetical protein
MTGKSETFAQKVIFVQNTPNVELGKDVDDSKISNLTAFNREEGLNSWTLDVSTFFTGPVLKYDINCKDCVDSSKFFCSEKTQQ